MELQNVLTKSYERIQESVQRMAIFRFLSMAFVVSGLTLGSIAATAEPEPASDGFVADFVDAMIHGKPSLDMTVRWENAKIDKRNTSNAYTVRTRLGYGTKALYGVSGFLEFENVASPRSGLYFDGVETGNTNKTIVADPEVIEANRFWLLFEKKNWGDTKLKVGRQRIKLDDDRWVGNVGWRQNEQTYDAVRLQTRFGHDNLLLQYMYSWENNRIFGDQGPANRRDFGMKAHFINVSYDVAKYLKATGFVYLIDANDPFAANSSNTYGFRALGKAGITDALTGGYEISWAYQTDAANNPVDYAAQYYHLAANLSLESVGMIKVGYEVLGSDDGKAVVVTPLSTAHKFNGFADAFLNNGGPRGVRDAYVVIAPSIPIKNVGLRFIFHQFYSDQGGNNLGQEYDLVGTYRYNKYVSFLYKFAYYDEGNTGSPQSRLRSVLQTTFKF